MNTTGIIVQLRSERDRLDRAIAALESGTGRRGRPASSNSLPARKRRGGPRRISADARKRLSQMMKQRWAARKKFSEFVPQLNPWYSPSGEYVGPAEFDTPDGAKLRGEGKVIWQDSGDCQISVDIDPSLVTLAAPLMLSDAKFSNFKLNSPEGIFSADSAYLAGSKTQFGATFSIRFELTTLAAEFIP